MPLKVLIKFVYAYIYTYLFLIATFFLLSAEKK
jgi:hypothetical protein